MHKLGYALLAMLAGVTAPSLIWANCDAGETRIEFRHDNPPYGNPRADAANVFADIGNGMLQGRACITVTAQSPDYDDLTVSQDLKNGVYQMAAPTTSNLGTISPRFLVFDLPFLFDDIGSALAYNNTKPGKDLLKEGASAGLTGLSIWADGMKSVRAASLARAPEQMQNMVFGIQGSQLERDLVEILGAQAQQLRSSQISSAFNAGEIKAFNASLADIYARALYSEVGGVIETNHTASQFMVVVNDAFWQSLPEDVRTDLFLAVELATHEHNRNVFELNNYARYGLLDEGAAIVRLDEAERLAWIRAMQPVWFKYGGDVGFDQISSALHVNRFGDETMH